MTTFRFATCDRRMALGFLRKLYPSRTVEDTPEDAGPVLDLVQEDIFRIPDPDFHSGAILPSNNWDESRRQECIDVLATFHGGPVSS